MLSIMFGLIKTGTFPLAIKKTLALHAAEVVIVLDVRNGSPARR